MVTIDNCVLTGGRPNSLEMKSRLNRIHKYVTNNPSAKPADLRMELLETTHMIRKYFKLIKECENID